MVRVVLALAILAVFSGMAAAQLALCDIYAPPPPPMNALVTSNVANSGRADITVTWRGRVNSNKDGCVDQYLLEVVDPRYPTGPNNLKFVEIPAKPDNSQYKATISHDQGQNVAIRLRSKFSSKGQKKESPLVQVGNIKTAGTAPQKPQPL